MLDIVKLVNALQFRNAKQASLELTVVDEQPNELAMEGGNITEASVLHAWNTCIPNVTLLGNFTEVRELQP